MPILRAPQPASFRVWEGRGGPPTFHPHKGLFHTKATVLNYEPPLYHHEYGGSFLDNFCWQENTNRGQWQRSLINYLQEKKNPSILFQKASFSHSISWSQTCPLWCHGSVTGSWVDLILSPNWNKREVGSKESCSGARFGGTSSPLEALQSRETSLGERCGREQEGSAAQGAREGRTCVSMWRESRGSTNFGVPPTPQAEPHGWCRLLLSLRPSVPQTGKGRWGGGFFKLWSAN